jgi:hypothetical protein
VSGAVLAVSPLLIGACIVGVGWLLYRWVER